MGSRRTRAFVVAAVAGFAAVGLAAAPAMATFHEMKIREVFPGTTAASTSDFVELQMFASGQTFVTGKQVKIYGSTGTVLHKVTMGHNVTHGENQRTILIGTSTTSVTPDFTDEFDMSPAGGAACYVSGTPPDCVSWGNFTGNAMLPSTAGTPAVAAGIPDGDSLKRSITPGCPTLLEAGDDTNDSATDFALNATPATRSNDSPILEAGCPNTIFKHAPGATTKDRTPTFRFRSTRANSTFRCKRDSGHYKPCISPKTLHTLSFGRHVFRVKAKDTAGNVDPSPAKATFRVVH